MIEFRTKGIRLTSVEGAFSRVLYAFADHSEIDSSNGQMFWQAGLYLGYIAWEPTYKKRTPWRFGHARCLAKRMRLLAPIRCADCLEDLSDRESYRGNLYPRCPACEPNWEVTQEEMKEEKRRW